MNYYKRHLGDYARDTGHLTALEHGIYTLLLDWYYTNERPIPTEKAIRIARGNPSETESVLREFFVWSDEGWRHHYADREIASYHARAETNRATGKLGGRPRKTESVSKRNPDITLATSHKPLTTTEAEAKADASPAKRGHRLPPDWHPSDADVDFAVSERVNWRRELEGFRDFWTAKSGKDACKLDWSATWRNWIRKAPRQSMKPAEPVKSQTRSSIESIGRMIYGNVDAERGGNGARQVVDAEASRVPRLGHDRDDSGHLD